MSNEIRVLLLKHKLKCLKGKQKEIQAEIEHTKEQLIFEQDKLLRRNENESK